jgi:endo-1,4-beta-xylanase
MKTLGLMLVVLLPISGLAQTPTNVLPDKLYEFSGEVGLKATAAPINITGQSFTQGYRLTANTTSAKLGDAALQWPNAQAIKAGDNLTLTFWVRKIAPLDGHNIRGRVVFGKAEAEPSLATQFPCDSDIWTKYSIPFKAKSDYAADEARLSFQFAHGPQTFEIGGISLTDAGPTPPIGAPGAAAIPDNSTQTFFSYFDQSVGGGSATRVPASGQSFTEAIRITVNGTSPNIYNAGVGWRNSTAISRDDALLLTFWIRKLEPADQTAIRGQVVFEKASDDYAKSLIINYPVETSDWKLFHLPFKSVGDYAANAAQLVFQMAAGPQRFEIGGVTLINYGKQVTLAQLPRASYYPGRGDANAPWRAEANARINQYRKGALTVTVRDRTGQPLPNAQVFVQQTEHAFRFGSAVTAARLMGSGVDNDIYRSRVSSHFTTSVFENDLKWGLWECTTCTSFNKDQTRRAITWLSERNLAVRGHNLIWPSWRYMPNGLQGLAADELRRRIEARFNDVLSDAGVNGKLYQWDVINEPYTNFDVQGRISGVNGIAASNGVLGNEAMIQWFKLARQLDPQTKLFINDYNILEASGADLNHQNYFWAVCKWLIDNEAPLDGIGIQGHFGGVTLIPTMQTIIERYAQFARPLAITEFDFNTADEELQADFTRDFLTLIFSYPQFEDFLMWGFWERAHWLPDGAMYRADWSSKPNALVWNELLFNEWWTNENGASDAAGKFQTRGFKGEYNVTVRYERVEKTVTLKLGNNGEVVIDLDVGAPRAPVNRPSDRPIQAKGQ